MRKLLEELCCLDGVSGNESPVANYIIEQIKDCCEYYIDTLGNIIAFKKGNARPENKIMLDAHMDEVGLIVTDICDNGLLKFTTVGGIDISVLLAKRVRFSKVKGVITFKPIHLTSAESRNEYPEKDTLFIDIGAKDRAEAEALVKLGDTACFDTEFIQNGDNILAKAIDNRTGCAQLIKLLKEESAYDFYAVFSVQEEVGLRGARTAAYTIEPDYAIVLESTTAADIAGVPEEKQVCSLGKGVTLSFMDSGTLYDRGLYETALAPAHRCSIAVQTKKGTSGGNNSGAIHLTKGGVKTVTLSTPCRYIHSPASVADYKDIEASKNLAKALISVLA